MFGATKACRFFLLKSEKKSDEWREIQRESYNGLPSPHVQDIED